MIRILGIISLCLFATSAIIHLGTFIRALPLALSSAAVMRLTLPIVAVFAVMVFAIPARGRQPGKEQPQSLSLEAVPRALIVFCVALFLYAAVNFVVCISLLDRGKPTIEHGKPYLDDAGMRVRDLTWEEYGRMKAYEVRLWTGHLMVFSLAPAVYFLLVHPRPRSEARSATRKEPSEANKADAPDQWPRARALEEYIKGWPCLVWVIIAIPSAVCLFHVSEYIVINAVYGSSAWDAGLRIINNKGHLSDGSRLSFFHEMVWGLLGFFMWAPLLAVSIYSLAYLNMRLHGKRLRDYARRDADST